jgi:hypothetical protein
MGIHGALVQHTQTHPPVPVTVCTTTGAGRCDFAELVVLAMQHYVCNHDHRHVDPLYVAEELGAFKSADESECRAQERQDLLNPEGRSEGRLEEL